MSPAKLIPREIFIMAMPLEFPYFILFSKSPPCAPIPGMRNGKLGAILKNPTYTGITPEFWNSCDAVANKNYWHVWGIPNCGKGQPGQSAHVGHGTAPARFKNVRVGIAQC